MAASSIPNFWPYPFARLRRMSRRDAALESACARWLGVTRTNLATGSLARLLGVTALDVKFDGAVARPPARVVAPQLDPDTAIAPNPTAAASPGARRASTPPETHRIDVHGATLHPSTIASESPIARDRDAAYAELRIAGVTVPLVGGGLAIRGIAQRLFGGPAELAAPRPLVPVEHAVFALVVATACDDLGIAAEVVPCTGPPSDAAVRGATEFRTRVGLGELDLSIAILVPHALALRMPPARVPAAWTDHVVFTLPIVAGRTALTRAAIAQLAPRDIVMLEGRRDHLVLEWRSGEIGLHAPAGAVEARVATGYGERDMALPDDAHVELTVMVGTTQLSLRQLVELTVGQVVPLGRPLAGPFELRVAGKAIGTGELVDLDGELGVRVTTVGD